MSQIHIAVAKNKTIQGIELSMANRHGLIAGATGTGKTVTLQKMAELFSAAGVPVFMADVKGDLAGMVLPGLDNPKIVAKLKELAINNLTAKNNPVQFWDLYGVNGLPLRTTISEMGPLLLGRLLDLNETQQGVLNAAFKFADDEGLLLLDLKDLRAILDWLNENKKSLATHYGNISSASLGAIQRALLSLAQADGEQFFAEPAFNFEHLLQKNIDSRGIINILDATKLIADPRLYSTFLLWLLSELFEKLPEVGDLDKPKLVFIFDEAHLLFDSAPKSLLDKIQQVARLIRSKGVGIYFVTQNPLDVPEAVLSQLGNRVQHALRAFTPKDQKAVKTAAETFRSNPEIDTAKIITELAVGEALLSILDGSGTPTMVEKVQIIPPQSHIGAISEVERNAVVQQSAFKTLYQTAIDRESAYEILQQRVAKNTEQDNLTKTIPEKIKKASGRPRQTVTEVLVKSTARSLGGQIGKQIIRGLLGVILGKK